MQDLVLTTKNQLAIEIEAAVQRGVEAALSLYGVKPQTEPDEFGGVEFASKITGKAVPTIYDLCSKRLIPTRNKGNNSIFQKTSF